MSMDEAMERAVKDALDDRACRWCHGYHSKDCGRCDGTGTSPLWRILEAVVPKEKSRAVIQTIDGKEKLCYCGIEYSMAVAHLGYLVEYTVEFSFGKVALTVHRNDAHLVSDMFTAILESRK